MAPRDRLADLHRRAAGAADAAGAAGAAGAASAVEAGVVPEPPPHERHIRELLDEAERTRTLVLQLRAHTQHVRRLHADTTFHNNTQLQEQLQAVCEAAGAMGLQVCAALRALEQHARGARNDAAGRIARLQYASARAHYAAALDDHHAALSAVRDARRHLLHDQLALTRLSVSEEECERLLDGGDLQLFVDNVRADTACARRVLRDVEARRDELARVEAALKDVRDLFTQLAVLVAAQQEQVDTVEYYALQATEHVESGHHHLLKGTVSRANTRKKKMSLIICVMAGVFIVLLVLVCT